MNRLKNGKISCGSWFKDTNFYMKLVGPKWVEEIILRPFMDPPSQHTFRQT